MRGMGPGRCRKGRLLRALKHRRNITPFVSEEEHSWQSGQDRMDRGPRGRGYHRGGCCWSWGGGPTWLEAGDRRDGTQEMDTAGWAEGSARGKMRKGPE